MIEDPQLEQIFRMEAGERLARLDSGLLELERRPGDPAILEDLFREMHSLKGAARMLGLPMVETTTHDLETLLNGARRGSSPLTAEGIEALNTGLKKLRSQIAEVLSTPGQPPAQAPPTAPPEAPAKTTAPPAPPPPETPVPFQIETVRVETSKLDDLLTLTGELGILRGRNRYRQGIVAQLLEEWTRLEACRQGLRAARHGADEAVARQQEKEDAAVERLGRLLQAAREAAQEDTARLESSLSLLQEQVQAMRLLPLSAVFGLFPRMVRDLAKEQGKDIDLHVEGADITLDKRILEEIKDPLMHLLRNAIGHGVEPPAERLAKGKPEKGSIRLKAERAGDHVIIRIEDDGRGLDLDAIRRKALQAGLAAPETLEAMPPALLQQLIFSPGFSTLSAVTELAGRGVGLDVVQANVEHLKGGIRLDSIAGAGTTFSLRLPLSLTTCHILVVQVAGLPFGLPLENIRAMGRQPAGSFYRLENRIAMDLDGQPILAPPLASLLELPQADPIPDGEGRIIYVILDVENDLLALQVDELLGEEVVVPRHLGAPLRRLRNVASLATLASGKVCPLLRLADLCASAHDLAIPLAAASTPASPAPAAVRPGILLVEDSALVRAMEKRVIEDAGYEVVTAVDGADGLAKLGSRSFAAIVSDIQMPNLDGLEFTAQLRQDPRYRDLPVILVSTLESEADRRRGLEVGATAYLPKPSFDQRELVETLRRLIHS